MSSARSTNSLPAEVVTVVVEELTSWFSSDKLRKICKKFDLVEPRRSDAPRKEYESILREALVDTPGADLLLRRLLHEFNQSRPPKNNVQGWDSWQVKHDRILRPLRRSGLDARGFPIGDPVVPAGLASVLVVLDSDLMVMEALSEAGRYIRGDGNLDPHIAGGLLRSAMEAVHQEIVSELHKIHGKPCSLQSDGERRAYMSQANFISKAEERLSSSIYSLVSGEVHSLSGRKDTVFFVQSTMHNYFALLLGRLSEKKKAKC